MEGWEERGVMADWLMGAALLLGALVLAAIRQDVRAYLFREEPPPSRLGGLSYRSYRGSEDWDSLGHWPGLRRAEVSPPPASES